MLCIPCPCTQQPTQKFGLGAGYFRHAPCCDCTKCQTKYGYEAERACMADARRFDKMQPLIHYLEADRKLQYRYRNENKAEVKKIETIAKFRTGLQMEERKMDLERRGERLKRMMDDDIYSYSQQIVNEFEQEKDSKIDVMRKRVAELRQKREIEDRRLVDAKLEQSFQNSCEQLRTLRVKKMAREITNDWDEQIKMKERLECEREENDRMYDYLWLKDAENKFKFEKACECARAEAWRKGIEELDRQLEYKRKHGGLRSQIIAKEIAENEKINQEIEDQRKKLLEEKQARIAKAKEHVKDMIATKDYYRSRRLKREEIVAIEFLKKAVRELYVQATDRNKAKRELARAIDHYLEYLKNRDCLANTRDVELQTIIDNVIEEQYQKTYATRRREQAQKRQLFCSVMKGRAEQVQDLKLLRQEEEAEYRATVEKLKADWKLYLQELEAEKEKKKAKQRQYRQELDCQTQYKSVREGRELDEFCRNEEVGDMQEVFFNDKLQKTIYQTKDVQRNPFREPLVGKHIKQCLRPV